VLTGDGYFAMRYEYTEPEWKTLANAGLRGQAPA